MADTPFPLPTSLRQTDVLVGDGRTTYGPFGEGWGIFDEDDVAVQVLPVQVAFTVEKVALSEKYSAFTITFARALTAADTYQVKGKRRHRRELAVTRGGAIDGVALELELSKQAVVLQEQTRDIDDVTGRVDVLEDFNLDFAADVAAVAANVALADEDRIAAENAAAAAVGASGVLNASHVAGLLANTAFSYTAGSGLIQLFAGQYVRTLKEGYSYQVAASGASDHHITTAGGVKLYAISRDGKFGTTTAVDVFVVYGQSNAQGQPASSVGAPNWIDRRAEMWNGSAIVPLSNSMPTPSSGTFGGSAWPAFANEWCEATGRRAVFINAAKGSQTINDLQKVTATNFTAMLAWVNATKSAITGRGDTLGNVYILFNQGEADQAAATIYETYYAALDTLWADLKADTGASHMFLWPLGLYLSASVRQAWPIQMAQRTWASDNDDVTVAYDGLGGFNAANGLSNNTHYTMAGYNLMGREGAKTAVAQLFDNGAESDAIVRKHGALELSSFQRWQMACVTFTKATATTWTFGNTTGRSSSFVTDIDATTDPNELRVKIPGPVKQYILCLAEPMQVAKQRGLVACARVQSDTDELSDDYVGIKFSMLQIPLRVNMTAGTIDCSSLSASYTAALALMKDISATFPSAGNCTITHPNSNGLAGGAVRGSTGRDLRVNGGATSTPIVLRDSAGALVNDEVVVFLNNIEVSNDAVPIGTEVTMTLIYSTYRAT